MLTSRLLTLTSKQPKLNPDVKTVIHQAIMSAKVKTKTPPAKQSDLVEQAFANLLDVRAAYDSEAGLDKLKLAYLLAGRRMMASPAKVVSLISPILFGWRICWRKCGWTQILW